MLVHEIRIHINQRHTMSQVIRIDVPQIVNSSVFPILGLTIGCARPELVVDFIEVANESTAMSTPTFVHDEAYISVQIFEFFVEKKVFKVVHGDFRNSVLIVPETGVVLVFETLGFRTQTKNQHNYQDLHVGD